MYQDVEARFDKEINRIFHEKYQIAQFLLKHERKKVCLEKLCEEIRMYEIGKANPSLHQYEGMIRDVAKMFAQAALTSKEHEILSTAERMRRVMDYENKKEIAQEMRVVGEDGKLESLTESQQMEVAQLNG